MKNLQFPMVLTHRSNPHAQVVVANAEQLAEIPEDYLPATVDGAAVVTAAAAIPGVNLETGAGSTGSGDNSAALAEAEGRQSLNEAVDEFTAHVQSETAKLDAARAQIDADRAELVKQAAALAEQSEALTRERAEFEAQRAAAAAGTGDIGGDTGTASATAEGAATGDAAAPAAPAKRTRGAGKEGA